TEEQKKFIEMGINYIKLGKIVKTKSNSRSLQFTRRSIFLR
ncbi:unnamed protein product, partial [marine sediment metagenome]